MTKYVQELTSAEVCERIARLAKEVLGTTVEDALARLERGELDELVVSAQLRGLLFLLGERT